MRKGVLTKTSIKVLLSLLLLIGSFEPVVSASYGGSKPADVTFESYFPLREVRLLDSPFLDLQRKGKEYLLWLNPDSLLHFYRIEAGLPSKACTLCRLGITRCMGCRTFARRFLRILSFFCIYDVSVNR